MKLKIEKLPLAKKDLEEQALFIGQDSLQAAEEFLKNTKDAFTLLAKMPLIGSAYVSKDMQDKMKNVRVWHIPGFDQHRIFYIPQKDRIIIIRILYTTRRTDTLI